MNIYFAAYTFTNTGTSGANVYHYNLAMVFLQWGWTVRAVCQQTKEPKFITGVEVYPMAAHQDNLKWADVVFSFPGPHVVSHSAKSLIIIKHNNRKEPYDHANHHILYCGQNAMNETKKPCKSDFVFNPINRYAGRPMNRISGDGPWMLVNCNDNKGGGRLIELAKRCPTVQFVGVTSGYGGQIKGELHNLSYWPETLDMAQYYTKVAGVLSLSAREGFPTVIMEAMAFGLPIAGIESCKGFMDVAPEISGFRDINHIAVFLNSMLRVDYLTYKTASYDRHLEIEHSRNYDNLKKFVTCASNGKV